MAKKGLRFFIRQHDVKQKYTNFNLHHKKIKAKVRDRTHDKQISSLTLQITSTLNVGLSCCIDKAT